MDRRKLSQLQEVKKEVDFAEIMNSPALNAQFLDKVQEMLQSEKSVIQNAQMRYLEMMFKENKTNLITLYLMGTDLNKPTPSFYLFSYWMYRIGNKRLKWNQTSLIAFLALAGLLDYQSKKGTMVERRYFIDKKELKSLTETRKFVKEVTDQKKSTLEAQDVYYFFTGFHVKKSNSLFRDELMLGGEFI